MSTISDRTKYLAESRCAEIVTSKVKYIALYLFLKEYFNHPDLGAQRYKDFFNNLEIMTMKKIFETILYTDEKSEIHTCMAKKQKELLRELKIVLSN